jgi:hypothetical protein
MLAGSLAAAANMTGWDRYLWLENNKNGYRQKSLQGSNHSLSSSSENAGSIYQNLLLEEEAALDSMSRIQPFDENTTIIH